MRHTLILFSVLAFASVAVFADGPPEFFKDTYPENALPAAWEEYKAIYSADGAVSAKAKQLIALGVSAQIPCAYCVYAHTKKAKSLGATDAEIREALAVASMVRKWSTVLNGAAYDLDKFKAEVDAN